VTPPRPGFALAEAAEAAVVALAAAGDDAAYTELVRRRHPAIRNLMRRLCRDAALADDLSQQVFLQGWRALRGLKSPGAFGGWLRRLAINVWLQHERAKRDTSITDEHELEAVPAPAESWTERIDLDSALATLPPDVRLCVVLAYSEGLSHGEISAVTALPLGTVKSHIARGAARLRELLQPYQPREGMQHG
jgi:RNA polymerase sigma-70 factor (ECF subfamily)